jgi:hypothetical protein
MQTNRRANAHGGTKGYWRMATPKRTARRTAKTPRVPSDEELARLRAILEYGRAMAIAKRAGIPQLMMPALLRIRNPAPVSDQAQRDKIMARMDAIIEERVRARLEAAGIPYTDERPYHHWVEGKGRAAAPPAAEAEREASEGAP